MRNHERLAWQKAATRRGETQLDAQQRIPGSVKMDQKYSPARWANEHSAVRGYRLAILILLSGLTLASSYNMEFETFNQVVLTAIGSGRFVKLWDVDNVYISFQNSHGCCGLLAQVMDEAGSEIWEQPVQINKYTSLAQRGSFGVAALGGDHFAVAWQSDQPYAIVTQVFSTAGTRIGHETPVTEAFILGAGPGVSFTANGFVVVWQETEVVAQLFDLSGNKKAGAGVIHVTDAGFSGGISLSTTPVAAIGSNGFVIVWSEVSRGIVLQRFNISGGKVGVEVQLSRGTGTSSAQAGNFTNESNATVKSMGSDGFVVVFRATQLLPGEAESGLFAQACDSSGNNIGLLARVDPNTRENHNVGSFAVAATREYPTSITFAPALGTGLRATYYESESGWLYNSYGAPLRSTSSDLVDFSTSGGDAPFSVTQDDTYSARWAGLIRAPATATLTFGMPLTNENDRVRLWIDNRLMIDAWTSIWFSGVFDLGPDRSLPVIKDEVYNIQIAYKRDLPDFRPHGYQLLWKYDTDGSTTTNPIPRTHLYPFWGSDRDEFLPFDAGSGTGLSATYFDFSDFQSAAKAVDSESVDFSASVFDSEPQRHSFASDGRFSVRWEGMIRAPNTTTDITFRVTTGLDQDERVKLWIDNSLLISEWTSMDNSRSAEGWYSTLTDSPPIRLTPAQLYDIKIEYKTDFGSDESMFFLFLDWSYIHSGIHQELRVPITELFPPRPTDRIVVAWTDWAEKSSVVLARMLDATGSLIGSEFQVSASTQPFMMSPSIVLLGKEASTSISASWIPSTIGVGWNGSAIESRTLYVPSSKLTLAFGQFALPRPEYLHCGLNATWNDFFQCRKAELCPYKTGGLGKWMQRDIVEVWVCIEHPCASLLKNADPRFCYVYHEKDRRFVAWGPKAALDIQIP